MHSLQAVSTTAVVAVEILPPHKVIGKNEQRKQSGSRNEIMPRRRRRKEDLVDFLLTVEPARLWLIPLFAIALLLSVWWWWHCTPDGTANYAVAALMGYARWLALLPVPFAIFFTGVVVYRGIQRASE
jgi:hypothetical protein